MFLLLCVFHHVHKLLHKNDGRLYNSAAPLQTFIRVIMSKVRLRFNSATFSKTFLGTGQLVLRRVDFMEYVVVYIMYVSLVGIYQIKRIHNETKSTDTFLDFVFSWNRCFEVKFWNWMRPTGYVFFIGIELKWKGQRQKCIIYDKYQYNLVTI